jgi:hypothetical protein
VCVCVLCVWVELTIQCTQLSPLCARCACVCVGTAPTKSGTSAGATRPTTASPDALVNGAVEKEVCSDDEFAPLGYEKGAAVATLMDESDCSDDGDEKANAGGWVCVVWGGCGQHCRWLRFGLVEPFPLVCAFPCIPMHSLCHAYPCTLPPLVCVCVCTGTAPPTKSGRSAGATTAGATTTPPAALVNGTVEKKNAKGIVTNGEGPAANAGVCVCVCCVCRLRSALPYDGVGAIGVRFAMHAHALNSPPTCVCVCAQVLLLLPRAVALRVPRLRVQRQRHLLPLSTVRLRRRMPRAL